MGKSTTSKSQQNYYTLYKSQERWKSNRKRRLEKTYLQQPNNEQIEAALKVLKYRRRIPTTAQWSASKRNLAQLFKQFVGRCDPQIFHSNEKISAPALQSAFGVHTKVPEGKVSFRLGDRAHDKLGNLVWAEA